MVPYKVVEADNNKIYSASMVEEHGFWFLQRIGKITVNLNKMLAQGRAVKLVIPERILSKDEEEEYRRYFCHKAKRDGVNYIYYPGEVYLSKKDILEGTMFE